MGLMKYLRGVFGRDKESMYAAWLTDSVPIFSSFGNDVYLSDFVNNAVDRIASEISKITIKSIIQNEDSIRVQNDDITRLFRFKPNPLQTTSDFLANIEWLRRKYSNAFIYPQYEAVGPYRRYKALYPLKPIAIYIGENNGQVWEIKMDFEDGSSYALPYSDLIHLRWRRGVNTVIGGGDDYGRPNNRDLLRVIDSLDKTIQGLPKSIEASLQIKGVYSAKSLIDKEELTKSRDDFESHIFTSKAGLIATDLAGEFTPVRISPPDISKDAMEFLKAVIQERYGVSAAILSGDYTGAQHDAFYQTAIEDFIVQFEQAMTACLFTPRELDIGHAIRCYYSRVNYMSDESKDKLTTHATNVGLMTLNQIGEMYGMEPFEGGDVRMRSLNYVEDSIANQYQLEGKKNEQD